MDTLHNYMVTSPLPCVYFVISHKEQMKIYSLLSAFNKNRNSSKGERFYLKVVEKDKMNQSSTKYYNWFQNVVEEPTCVVYCSDWQRYKVESSKVLGSEMISDPSLVDVLSKSSGSDNSSPREQNKKSKSDKHKEPEPYDPNIIRITSKNLEKLIKDDVEKFLVASRRVNEHKTVRHKFLLLITLNKNVKHPNKVVGGLKHLDPSEVCAVCVSCGLTDINSKLEKLEQMIYETSISYYEKKIKKLAKIVVNVKSHMKVKANEITEMYFILLNFKLGYFSEFLLNRKEAYGKYMLCWNAIKQMNKTKSLIDKTSLSFFICLRLLEYLFFTSDIATAFAIYIEYKLYLESLILDRYRGLYYNLMYLVNYFIAYKLEQLAMIDEKNTTALMNQSSNYFKWAVDNLMNIRKHILKLSSSTGFSRKDQMYMARRFEEGYDREVPENNKVDRKYYLPCDLNNVFYYEDTDYGILYDDKNYGTDNITENDLEIRGDDLDLFQVLEEQRLEAETLKLVLYSFKVYKNLNHSNHLLYMCSQLGDSFYLANNCIESLKIYIMTLKHILYNSNFTQNYPDLIRRYGVTDENTGGLHISQDSMSFDYVQVIHMLVYSELISNTLHRSLYINVLSKIMLSMLILMKVKPIPQLIYRLARLPNTECANLSVRSSRDGLEHSTSKNESGSNSLGKELEMYVVVLIKCLITFVTIYRKENTMLNYLNYILDLFSGSHSPNRVTDVKAASLKKNSKVVSQRVGDKTGVAKSVHSDELGRKGMVSGSVGNNQKLSETRMKNLESYILLSKYTKSQYLYKYELGVMEIIINFQTDLNLKLKFSQGSLQTTEGSISFYYKKSQYISNTFIIFCTQTNGVSVGPKGESKVDANMVELPNDGRIILILQIPFYTVKSLRILGIILKTYYKAKILINAILLTSQYVINKFFKKLSAVINLGYYTSKLRLAIHSSNDRDDRDAVTLSNLLYISLNSYINSRFLNVDGCESMDILELMKLMNMNMKMKIFIKNVVMNFMSPITVVLLHNRKFHHLYDQFSYQFRVSGAQSFAFYNYLHNHSYSTLLVDHNDFYVFSKDGSEHILCKTGVLDYNTDEPKLFYKHEKRIENIKLGQNCGKYKFFDYSHLKESELEDCEMDEDIVKYIKLYINNYNVYVLYGLMNVGNDFQNNIKFNVHIRELKDAGENRDGKLRDAEKLLKKETRGNILLYSKILDMNVNNGVNLNINYKHYKDNGLLLYINLINNTDIFYQLLKINILYNNRMVTNENTKLHGFTEIMNANENLNFVYIMDNYKEYKTAKPKENVVQVQITKYIKQKLYYPFNHMNNFLKITINKMVHVTDKSSGKIELKLKHKYIANLGKPVELKAEIKNTTNETVEYDIRLTDENIDAQKPFILQGPLNLSLVAMPRSSDTLKWTLIPIRCKIFKVPMIQVISKLGSSKNKKVKSRSSQIYVIP